jgi:hypothetical protein
LVAAFSVGAVAPSTASADVIYHGPRYNGVPLDHCWYWATNCGWARAHWWCRAKGHPGARAYRLYRPGRTYVVGSRRVCVGGGCVAYSRIRCIGSRYGGGRPGGYYGQYRVNFNYPRMNGAIVDHCRWFAASCGWPAAHRYCRLRGFSRAIYWSRYRPGRTWVIGSRRYCRGPGCVGFSRITCTR